MFNFIKNSLTKLYHAITSPLQQLFARTTIDKDALTELERILIQADTGALTTRKLMSELSAAAQQGRITDGASLKTLLHEKLLHIITAHPYRDQEPQIYLLVGINGSGKTTCASKLAYQEQQKGKKVLLVAADTFRAAAREQLAAWASQLNVDIVIGKPEEDPAAVIFTACQKFTTGAYDVLIIDTAGRLQTKTNLMKELEKMGRVITKQLPDARTTTLLTVDSMLGQNSFEQAKLFHESTPLSGIILTKMDGTGKGGIVFAISQELHIPIAYLSFGEQVEKIKLFNASEYIETLLG